jgi:hypothetical protein
MARDTDRKQVSEAVRLNPLWTRESFGKTLYNGGSYVQYKTSYDETLTVWYGPKGFITEANYRHWDGAGHRIVAEEKIKTDKRKRVLVYLNQKDVTP